jgi:hypothetical protein
MLSRSLLSAAAAFSSKLHCVLQETDISGSGSSDVPVTSFDTLDSCSSTLQQAMQG